MTRLCAQSPTPGRLADVAGTTRESKPDRGRSSGTFDLDRERADKG